MNRHIQGSVDLYPYANKSINSHGGLQTFPKNRKKEKMKTPIFRQIWKPQNTECDNPHVFFKPFNIYQKDESG